MEVSFSIDNSGFEMEQTCWAPPLGVEGDDWDSRGEAGGGGKDRVS